MKVLFRSILKFAPLFLFVVTAHVVTTAQTAKIQLDQLDVLANRASETVDVKLDEHLMQTTAKFFSGKDGDDAEIRDLIKNVKGIYVKSFTFEKAGEYSQVDIDSIMSQLRGSTWSKWLQFPGLRNGRRKPSGQRRVLRRQQRLKSFLRRSARRTLAFEQHSRASAQWSG